MEGFQLEKYLSNGVENIVKGIVKAAVKNPRASLFMMQYGRGIVQDVVYFFPGR